MLLKIHETILLKENQIFILKKGKVLLKSTSIDGKIINNNMFLQSNEFIFNCFDIYNNHKFMIDIEVEVEALEDSILEEVKNIKGNELYIYEKMLMQLMKKNIIEFRYKLYSTKKYILLLLKLLANSDSEINKKNIKPEIFNIGKTQFYKIYKNIKEEKLIKEKEKEIYINKKKIDEYLLKYK